MRIAALFLGFAVAASAADIPQGAHVLLRMENSITTRTAQDGDYVYLRTVSPISAGGAIAVPAGSYVQGMVTHAKPSGRVRGRAELAIRLETLTLPTGAVLKFAPRVASVDAGATDQRVTNKEGDIKPASTRGADAARIAILAGYGAATGAIVDRDIRGAGIGAGAGAAVGLATVLLTRGKEAELRQGTTLDVVFDRPVTLE